MVEDHELLELVELDVRELLAQYGYAGTDVPVIRGSAKLAHDNPADPTATRCINELLSALDTMIPDPVRQIDKPFLMPIENVFSIAGRGTVVTGKIEQGIVRAGDAIEIIGPDRASGQRRSHSSRIVRRCARVGQAGDNVGCLLRKTAHDDVLKAKFWLHAVQ